MDGSNVDEGSLPFSFPSYFIDEDAVVCLEGDACLVRAALRSPDVEGAPAADTSVACDLCDFWYHAECVNFDMDQSFFCCPRCIAVHEQAGRSLYPARSRVSISNEARTPSMPMGPLSNDVRTLLGGTSVEIAAAEEGESAVSVSMHRIPAPANPLPRPVEDNREMWSPIREPIKVSQPYRQMWSPIREPPKVSQNTAVMWSPIREPLNVSQNYDLWSPTHGALDQGDIDVESLSPTPASEKAMANPFKEERNSSLKVSAESFKPVNSIATNDSKTPRHSTGGFENAAGQHLSRYPSLSKVADVVDRGENINSRVSPLARPSKTLEESAASGGVINSNEIKNGEAGCDDSHRQVEVENIQKRKQVVLREDDRRIESKDLPEPPRKIARKVTKKADSVVSRNAAVAKDPSDKIAAVESTIPEVDDNQSQEADNQSQEAGNCIISNHIPKEISAEEALQEEINDHQGQDQMSGVDHEGAPPGESESNVDVMDIVSGPYYKMVKDAKERSEKQMGVRTRIIMPRETDGQDAASSGLFERVREQMKTNTGYVGGNVTNAEVPNDRFIAAFKAALDRSREKTRERNSVVSVEKKSKWLPKFLKNADGKGSRESLTRKLYSGGTGRWDRDWDIAFWKERSAGLRKAHMEAEDEVTGSNTIGRRTTKENAKPRVEEDSIFSRLYVADTSLFPRNDNVQPLSVKSKTPERISSEPSETRNVKASQFSRDTGTALHQGLVDKPRDLEDASDRSRNSEMLENCLGVYNIMGSMTTATPTSKPAERSGDISVPGKQVLGSGPGFMEGVSPKPSAKAGLKSPLSSDAHDELTSAKNDVKKDKRQWALDVLARKQRTSGGPGGSSSTAEGSVNRERQFTLLLKLPESMRPILPHNRHSKIPTALRQVQLNRFVEHELKRANLMNIGNNPECEEAVKLAEAREDALYKRSKSKIVYLNLCVRSLAQPDAAVKVEQDAVSDVSDVVQKALEATGLIESPPGSPSHGRDSQNPASAECAAKASSNHSNRGSENIPEEKPLENDPQIGNLELYGDPKDNGDNTENASVAGRSCSSKLLSDGKVRGLDESVTKLTDVQTNASPVPPRSPEICPETPLEKKSSRELTPDDGIAKAAPLPVSEAKVLDGADGSEEAVPSRGLTGLSSPLLSNGHTVLTTKEAVCSPPEAELEAPKAKHSSPVRQDPESSSELAMNAPSIADNVASEVPAQADHSVTDDDWMSVGKFADLDRRIENIRQNSSPSANRELDVPWNSSRTVAELSSQTQSQDSVRSVKKQVEIFVNQHLKPLYRSGVIKADQFRFVVSKTAAKVMEHHEDASSAEFLITEGSKVRKLADQYLQAYSKRKIK